MPAITRVLSSGFFIPADADNFVTTTKATVGLGLGLPTEIFCTTFTHDELDRFVNESAPEDSSDESVASPPLLPTRRPRRSPPTFSVEDEYHPMDTPSPSLRGAPFETYGWILESSAPAAPTIPDSPNQPTTHTNIGLGIALPGLNEPELVTTVSQRDTKVGLGLDLPCLASHELVTIIHPTSSHIETDHSSSEEYAAAAPHSSCSSPSDECVSWTEVTAPTSERVIRRPTKECSPNLGFDSPFWRTYASVMAEKPLEVIYETA